MRHYLIRVNGLVQILDQLDVIGRTSELASLFGIQFYEVLSRGSQVWIFCLLQCFIYTLYIIIKFVVLSLGLSQ